MFTSLRVFHLGCGAIFVIYEKAYTKMAPQGVQTPLYTTAYRVTQLEPYGAIVLRNPTYKIAVDYSYNEVCSFIVA